MWRGGGSADPVRDAEGGEDAPRGDERRIFQRLIPVDCGNRIIISRFPPIGKRAGQDDRPEALTLSMPLS